jgi:hypothetical protein
MKLQLKVGDTINGHKVVHLGRDHRTPIPKPKREDPLSYHDKYCLMQLGLYGGVDQILSKRSGWRR